MSKIRVKNFGPISDGFSENDGFIDLNKIIVFIGSQGAGKSAIAKLIATFCWLEKALVRGDFSTVVSNSQNSFESELYEAASGLQSIIPLALVTQYNSELISSEKDSGKWEKYSFDELKKAKQLFDAQIKLLDSEILQQQFYAYMSQNNPWLYNFYLTNGFLLRCVNSDKKLKSQNTCNSLIITTHSPYIVEALNNTSERVW